MADLCSLDRCGRGLRAIRRAIGRGELRRFHEFDFTPFNDAYIQKVKRVLRRYGYLR